MKKLAILAVIIIISAYTTVIFHELSHAYFAYLYGCKTSPFNIYVSPYLAASNDGEYIEGCWEGLDSSKQLNIMSAGIIVNLILGSISFLSFYFNKDIQKNKLLYSFFFIFSLFNFLAGFTYLTLGSYIHAYSNNPLVWDDMQMILSITGFNPLIFFIPSTLVFIGIIYLYTKRLPDILKIYYPKAKEKHIKRSKQMFIFIIILLILASALYKLLT